MDESWQNKMVQEEPALSVRALNQALIACRNTLFANLDFKNDNHLYMAATMRFGDVCKRVLKNGSGSIGGFPTSDFSADPGGQMPETITELKVILDEIAESWKNNPRGAWRLAEATNNAIKAATKAMQSGQEKI